MKISFEVDITPEEVKELFEGNMDVLQRALMELFVKQMSQVKTPNNTVMAFWQMMSEKSTDMFEQYQKAMSGINTPKE